MAHVADKHESYVAAFEAARRRSDVLTPLRETAFRHFLARGFPSTREEEWRFTNVGPIADVPFEPAGERGPQLSSDALEPFRFAEAIEVVLINGRVASIASERLPRGVRVSRLSGFSASDLQALGLANVQAAPEGMSNPFASLNIALFEDAAIVQIDPHVIAETPVHVLHVNSSGDQPTLASPRLLIHAGDHSQATIIESYAGLGRGTGLTNAVTEVVVGSNAVVDHVKLQRESTTSFHMASTFVRLHRAATFASRAISFGGRIARNDIQAVLAGEGAECTLNGLYVTGGNSLFDTHTTIDHAQPHCPSHEVYKGILTGRARAVFNGKIIVRPDAQKTDAKQTNKALLLTDDAQINTKPQLEIFADDVKCTHGAAIGQLDEDAMFYLRARGIAEPDAKSLLIHAFAAEILDGVSVAAVRERAMHVLEEQLSLA